METFLSRSSIYPQFGKGFVTIVFHIFQKEKNYNYNLRINLARNTKCPVINNWKRRLSYAKENLY